MRGRVHHFHLDRVLAVITKIDEIRQLVTRSIPSPMTLAFAESREARHSRNSHHPLAMGDGFATTLVRCFAAACRVARPFSPANGDFYSRASGESPGNGIVAISRHASHQKAPIPRTVPVPTTGNRIRTSVGASGLGTAEWLSLSASQCLGWLHHSFTTFSPGVPSDGRSAGRKYAACNSSAVRPFLSCLHSRLNHKTQRNSRAGASALRRGRDQSVHL